MRKLLIISHKSPYTHIDGGVLAVKNLWEELFEQVEHVEMICFSTHKHPHLDIKVPEKMQGKIHALNIDTQITILGAFQALLKNQSYHLSRFYSEEISDFIKNKVSQTNWDAIVFESLFSLVYASDVRKYFKGKIIYRSHNIEHKIWERLANQHSGILKKWYLKKLTSQLKKEEKSLQNTADAIFAISKNDQDFYLKNGCVNSFLLFHQRHFLKRENQINPNHFFHLASMNWQPNIEAVEWFVEKVWKPVFAKKPNLKLFLGGKDMPEKYFDMQKYGIHAEGYIPHGDAYMQNHGSLIVPLFSGSGIRIKVVDALSLQVPVISTDIGVEGIGLIQDKHFLQANTDKEFQEAILSMNMEKINFLTENSTNFALENFDSKKSISRFIQQIKQLG
ncbi:MAG: glycosyltransferase [Flavobacteriales bacterium]|jgi:glycosyltransferase involved in cell wall biosynthesis|nr:glycosyltransferase [Flavobacteriales bacterium]